MSNYWENNFGSRSYKRMSRSGHHRRESGSHDSQDPDARRQPVFGSGSARFDRSASSNAAFGGGGGVSTGGSVFTTEELMSKLFNQQPHTTTAASAGAIQMERFGSQHQQYAQNSRQNSRHSNTNSSMRHSNVSEAIMRELALAETAFNPNDLLKEGLDEWHDRSLNLRLMKRSQSVTASRKKLRSSGKFPDGFPTQLPSRHEDDSQPLSQGGYYDSSARHRYDVDFSDKQQQDVLRNDDGSIVDIPEQYTAVLDKVPASTLVHLIILYHQALVHHGFKEEATKIADHLAQIDLADLEDGSELSGIDALLRDGLLKYMMTIQPYIPTIPKQVIKFKDVGFTSTVQLDTGYESIGTKVGGIVRGPFKKSSTEKVTSLHDVSGYLMPGSLTLVMGTPGSGKNVIAQVLSGLSKGKKGETTTGSVTYNGRSVHDIESKRFVSVVGPNDVHFPTLSVRETVEFARECSQYYKAGHYNENLRHFLGDVLDAGQDPKLETNLSIMGLKRVAERKVGSPMMPSISEAERHRLSVAEIVAGTYAVYFFEQLNKGLDHTVTFDLVTSLRIFARVRYLVTMMTLINPTQDVFDLFDRVIVLDRGQVLYQGPRQDALPYFETLGYIKPRQLSVPEYLAEVSTSDGAQFLAPGFPRLSVDAFAAAYKNSEYYKDVLRVVDDPENNENFWVQGTPPLGVEFERSSLPNHLGEPASTVVTSLSEKGGSLADVSMNHTLDVIPGDEVVAVGGSLGGLNFVKTGDSSKALPSRIQQSQEPVRLQLQRPLNDEGKYDRQFSVEFVQDPLPEFKLLLKRDLKATWRYKLGLMIRAVQVLVLGFYIAFVFFRVEVEEVALNFNLLRSVFFVSLLDMTLFNLGQLPGLFEERNIYYKQRDANFYRPKTYLFAKIVGSLPFSFLEATTWTFIVYFLTNLSVSDGGWHFWIFYLIILLTVLNGAATVRFLSTLAPNLVAANGMNGIMIAIFIIFAGFLIPKKEIRKYWIWAYYIDPLQWGIHGLVINEFTSSRYSKLCSEVSLATFPQCRGKGHLKIGVAYLETGYFYTSQKWIGVAVAVLVGWFLLWTLLTFRALSNIRHAPPTIITPSAENKFYRKTDSLIDRDGDLENLGPKLSLSPIPITLSWHELSYDLLLPSVKRTLPLISFVSGWAEPGEMIGIVGGADSGKTVLLNCLAGRKVDTGRIGGQILVNGYPRNERAFTRVMGYVEKLDAYSPYMTVLEAIAFNCELQQAKTTTLEQRQRFVREVIELLELKSIANNLVKSLANNFMTLSEAARLRIGTELARNPSIIFMDGPAYNLDSRAALHLIRMLRKIADTGRIVITSTTMPNHRTLTCFTAVQILKRGGETVYWGPVGRDGELLRGYFESIPGTPACPPNTSAAAYALDVIGDGVQERKAMKDYAFEYRVNELALHNHVQLQRLRQSAKAGSLGPEVTDTGYGSSYFTRARNIFLKMQLYYWRNVAYSWGRLFSSIMTALLLGSIYWQQKADTQPGMNTKAGAIFISTLLQALSNAQSVIPQVASSRAHFHRERRGHNYNVFLYSLSWTFGEVPYLAASTLVYCTIFLSMSDIAFYSVSAFFRYWFILFELTLGITFFGMLLASVAILPQIAGTLVTIFIGFWVATSGLVVPRRKVLPQFLWIFWTNPIQYAIGAMTTVAFYCKTNEADCLNHGLNPACSTDPTACPSCHCTRLHDLPGKNFTWNTISFNRSIDHNDMYYGILYLFCFLVVFRLLTFVVWTYQTKRKKFKTS